MPDSSRSYRDPNGHGLDNECAIQCGTLRPVGSPNIPPRQWAYGRFLLFGSAAVIGAVDGGGKGAIAVVLLLSMITGKPLLGERVWRRGPVAVITYEDDEKEWHRRIAGACLHYELDYAVVMQQVHFIRKPNGRIVFAQFEDGFLAYPDGDEVIHHLRNIGAVLLVIDPFNHAHALEDGNNNVMIAKVAAEMTRIAYMSGCAVLVLHHLRKGSTGNPDDLMGATSLRATFRNCRIFAKMTPEAAQKMNITDPWRYICIAGSKENYAPPAEKATWFKLIGVPLGNATECYPEGDEVAVAVIWQRRSMFEGMPPATLATVFNVLRQSNYSPHRQAKNWAGKVLKDIGSRDEVEATRIIGFWLENGVLTKVKHYDNVSRHNVDRVVLNEGMVAEILADSGYHAEPSQSGTCA
jgi:hypothetical protein